MSKRTLKEALAEHMREVAGELDDQRAEAIRRNEEQRVEAKQRHEEMMRELSGIRLAVGHWVDEFNQNKSHVEEQFRRDGERLRKTEQRISAVELVASKVDAE